jgi:hypothetical protein
MPDSQGNWNMVISTTSTVTDGSSVGAVSLSAVAEIVFANVAFY